VANDLAKLLTLVGRPHEALALLTALPAPARAQGQIAGLLVHLELIEAANQISQEQDSDADTPASRLTHAAQALFEDQPEQALAELLELARQSPTFRDDIGRRAMIALFGMLGGEHELTRRFRARLAELSV
jgi:putative thioredoxin